MPFETKGRLAIIPPLADPEERLIVVGDIHGDSYSFNTIKKLFIPNKDLLIFLGDYADRGPDSVKVVEGVQELIKNYPGKVIPLKGNHEDYTPGGEPMFVPCTLIEEVEIKRGSWGLYFKELRKNFLDRLYLSAMIPEKVLFVHGGISSKIRNEEDLVNPNKLIEENILWSDPYEIKGEYGNPRGAGVLFGPDISKEVTRRLNVKYIIRSHEPGKAPGGACIEHEGRMVTISSTRVYGGRSFVLILPFKDFPKAGNEIEKYVFFL
ncbi:MAG: metallophosphoesterase family protein [Thermodesulfovibrionales bacterium]|nr:metallophosphoesterase family protein [Thermodesulfovibrionales bacterium]